MAVFSLAVAADQNLEQLFLPKGYRFAPRDHELLIHYLANKILNHRLPANIIPTLHLYQYEPHQLPIGNFFLSLSRDLGSFILFNRARLHQL